ncbi:MAG: hypothetical protein JWP37_2425 [Mucilaginibacter sp.]|nr:hypothetical protein [Mucilaginibacter sp.]
MYIYKPSTFKVLRLKSVQTLFLQVFLMLLLVGILFPSGSYAQSNDVITNQTIIRLYRAGIGKQVIIAKIDNSTCNFDLSTDGLIDLKRNGVPDDLVSTMISKGNSANQAPVDTFQNNAPDPNSQNGGDPNIQAPAISANTAPPELPAYEQPPCPVDGFLWVPGYWAYSASNGYYWVPGVWVAPPNPGLLWTPAYWGYNGRYYGFHPGYWGAVVGFYGGINYGYGYGGIGFVGGSWSGRSFRYNTAVVRVNTTVIHNTYVDRTVVINNTNNNRTSFNGRGGIGIQPRPAEIAAMREHHIQATSEQISHQQAASSDKSQFARVNNGHPAAPAMSKINSAPVRDQNHVSTDLNRNNNTGTNKSQTNNENPPANSLNHQNNDANHQAGNQNLPTNNVTRQNTDANHQAGNQNLPTNNATGQNTDANRATGNQNPPANNANRQNNDANHQAGNENSLAKPANQPEKSGTYPENGVYNIATNTNAQPNNSQRANIIKQGPAKTPKPAAAPRQQRNAPKEKEKKKN